VELAFSSEQQQLYDAFDHFFTVECPASCVRGAEPLGFDRVLWTKLAAMEVWGSEASLADLCVMGETFGGAVAPVPFVEHAVASRLLGSATAEPIATVSLRPSSRGRWSLVPAGAVADVVIGIDGDRLVVSTDPAPFESPRNHASAPIADRQVTRDATVFGAAVSFETALAEWKVLTSAALVGIAAKSLQLAVEYVQQRQQFGVPIGSFQALQHSLADLPGMIDGGRLLVHAAAAALDRRRAGEPTAITDVGLNDVEDPFALAAMAIVFTGDMAARVTDRCLHAHGDYGFAEECDIQLYYRRARGWALLLGDPAGECTSLADRLWPVEQSLVGGD